MRDALSDWGRMTMKPQIMRILDQNPLYHVTPVPGGLAKKPRAQNNYHAPNNNVEVNPLYQEQIRQQIQTEQLERFRKQMEKQEKLEERFLFLPDVPKTGVKKSKPTPIQTYSVPTYDDTTIRTAMLNFESKEDKRRRKLMEDLKEGEKSAREYLAELSSRVTAKSIADLMPPRAYEKPLTPFYPLNPVKTSKARKSTFQNPYVGLGSVVETCSCAEFLGINNSDSTPTYGLTNYSGISKPREEESSGSTCLAGDIINGVQSIGSTFKEGLKVIARKFRLR